MGAKNNDVIIKHSNSKEKKNFIGKTNLSNKKDIKNHTVSPKMHQFTNKNLTEENATAEKQIRRLYNSSPSSLRSLSTTLNQKPKQKSSPHNADIRTPLKKITSDISYVPSFIINIPTSKHSVASKLYSRTQRSQSAPPRSSKGN
jgi:hypothetical protein